MIGKVRCEIADATSNLANEKHSQRREVSMRKQKGFSLIELLIVVAIILIIAAIAIPNLLRSKMSANDSAAASTIRTMNTSEVTYSTTYPNQGYANTLVKLGPGACDATAACLIDNVLACAAAFCPKSGYNYMMTSTAAAAPFGDYTASASPITMGSTGTRNYCSNADAVIRSTAGAIPPVAAPTSTTTPVASAACNTITGFGPIQ
jgi:type IV pilus assembly protein PilA